MVELVTIGELTLDHIVLPDGMVRSNVIGGGSLFSAIGARIWDASVGIHAVTGEEFFRAVIQKIAAKGINTTGIHHVPGKGLEMWLLHESTTVKQQIPKLSSAKMADLDAARKPLPKEYQTAKAFHLAPQSPDGHWLSLNALEQLSPKPFISMDIQADAIIDSSQYHNLSFCSRISTFLPSREEVQQIWQTHDLVNWMNIVAIETNCCVAVKMGDQGSLVLNPVTQKIFQVPAYPTNAIDTTGSGDAYCGGFLAGLMLGKDVVECAAMGTVSASFIVEAYGALDVPLPANTERSDRLTYLIGRVSKFADRC